MEDLKIKLAVLWIFEAVSWSAYAVLMFMLPGAIEEIMAGEIGGDPISEGVLLAFALFWLIPLTMAVMSLTLKDSANRWLNIIVGIAYLTIGTIISLIGGWLSIAHLLIDVSLTVALVLIVWNAWKWPKKKV